MAKMACLVYRERLVLTDEKESRDIKESMETVEGQGLQECQDLQVQKEATDCLD